MFGQQGDRPGNFAHPCGVATDHRGNIYVTDRQFENVQIFDAQGTYPDGPRTGRQRPGRILAAGRHLCRSSAVSIYVADSFNKRIQIFELAGGGEAMRAWPTAAAMCPGADGPRGLAGPASARSRARPTICPRSPAGRRAVSATPRTAPCRALPCGVTGSPPRSTRSMRARL